MRFQLFREKLTDCLEDRRFKQGLAASFFLIMATTFGLSVFAGVKTKETYCHTHNCTDASDNSDANKAGFGVGLATLVVGAAFISAISLFLICCKADRNEESQTIETGGAQDYQALRQ